MSHSAQEDSVAPAELFLQNSVCHTLAQEDSVAPAELFLQNSVCHTLAQEDSVASASVSTELSLSHSGLVRQCCTCFCFYRTQFVTLWLRKTVLHLLLFLQNSVCHTLAQEDSVAPASVSTELSLSHSGLVRQCCTCFCFYRAQFVTLWLGKTVLHLLLFLQNSVCRTLAQEDSVALLLFLQNSVCHTLAQEDSVAPASVSTELSLSHSGSGRQCCTASVSTELSLSHSGSGRQCCTCFCFHRTQFVTLWLRKTVLHLLLFLQNSVCRTLAQEDSVAPASVSTELSLSHSGLVRQCCTCFCFYRAQFVTLRLGKTVLHLLLFPQNSVCHTLAQEDSVAPASVSTELSLSHSGSGRQCCTCFCFYRTQFVTLWLRKTVLHLLLFLQNSVCHTLAQEDSVAPASVLSSIQHTFFTISMCLYESSS